MDLRQQNKQPKLVSYKENIIPTLSSLKCYFCLQKFSSEYSLKRHYSTVHLDQIPVVSFKNKEFRCDVCNKTFSRQDKLNEHVSNSKQHKQAVISQTNCIGSIDHLLSSQSNKRSQPSQDIEDDEDYSQKTKKQKTDSILTILLDKENDDPTVNNQTNGESESQKQSNEKQTQSVDDESDYDVILLEPLDPMTDELDKLDKVQLLALKSFFRETHAKIQKQYNLVKLHLKKFE